jgi:hypothetical protein
MATKKGGSGGKESVTPPSNRATSDGSKKLRQGSSAGGRVMADESVAKKQGVRRKP